MQLRPANPYQYRAAQRAEQLLSDALLCARTADCPKLTRKIRLAIASAGGAVRHASRRLAARKTYGVMHVTNSDPSSIATVETPRRGRVWFRVGQYA